MSFKNIFTYVNAASLLVIISAVLYFWGFVYYEAFFGYYGLSLSLGSLPTEYYLLTGWSYIFYAVGIFLTALFIYRIARWAGTEDGDFKRLSKRFPRLTRSIRPFISKAGSSILTLLVFLLLTFATVNIYVKAREDARSMARSKREIKFVTKSQNDLPNTLYFLAYAGGKYIVYSKLDENTLAQVYILNDSDVSRVTFVRR